MTAVPVLDGSDSVPPRVEDPTTDGAAWEAAWGKSCLVDEEDEELSCDDRALAMDEV